MAGAAAGGAQRVDGGGVTFQLYFGFPCLPRFYRAASVPQKKVFWKSRMVGCWERNWFSKPAASFYYWGDLVSRSDFVRTTGPTNWKDLTA